MAHKFKDVLVTGGCGFIGSNFIRLIYNRYPDYRIVNLDLLTYAGNLDNLQDIEGKDLAGGSDRRRYEFIHGDIFDNELLNTIFKKHQFDLVFNFAAETHVDRSIINMGDFIRTNIGGVRALIEAVRMHGASRFIHISTDEVYGSVEEGNSREGALLKPSNPYSASKAAADLIIQAFIRTHNVPAIIVRGSNNFGPYQYPEKLIPLAISNLIEGKKFPIHGHGRHIRSWIHVDDFSNAIDLVSRNAPLHEIYNVAGEEKTNLEILGMLARQLSLGDKLALYTEHINDRPGADIRYSPDPTKIKKELGWLPQHTLESSIGEVVSWYLVHQDWWKKIKAKKEFQKHYEKQSRGQWY